MIPPTDLDQIVGTALATSYDLPTSSLTRVGVGQNTVNLRARSGDRQMFVKTYPTGTDLEAEREAIGLSELAGDHGVPVAHIIHNQAGQTIDTSTAVAFSVWGWMPGTVVTDLGDAECSQAGQALGKIHAAFVHLPQNAAADTALRSWRTIDVPALEATIDRLLDFINDRARTGEQDPFDAAAARTLAERRIMLTHLPALVEELPPTLTVQVLHGDYSPVNLLFTDDGRLTAVLDFSPPRPDLVAYDLGRMAFYPNTVTSSRHWLEAARTFIAAYLAANPGVTRADVRACGRIALIQLLRSLYGVKQHYFKPGIDQAALDDFWLLRHQAAGTLLGHQREIDRMLNDLAHHL
ncbi:phosphotransferase enzyme family protein [Nocardiopsis alba]|uniref:phosphotransferase enzyme family protein n=1 Tax=Nocardiopsis alba TaxID=53437 RepID=UPI003670F55A